LQATKSPTRIITLLNLSDTKMELDERYCSKRFFRFMYKMYILRTIGYPELLRPWAVQVVHRLGKQIRSQEINNG